MDYTPFAPGNIGGRPPLPELLPPHKNFTHKLIGAVLIFVALGGAVTYGIWWWGNQYAQAPVDNMAGWQTYRNDQYGFEFKYPEMLNLKEDRYTVVLSHDIPYENHGDCDMTGDTKTYKNLTDFSLSFEVLEGVYSPKVIDGEYKKGELAGTWFYSGIEYCGEYLYYFPAGVDHTLLIRRATVQATSGISAPDDLNKILSIPGAISKEESQKIFDQILSTFKFIDSPDISTWKTYRNDKYGFEIKYPLDYDYQELSKESGRFEGIFSNFVFYVWFGRKPLLEEGPVEFSVDILQSTIENERSSILKNNKGSNFKEGQLNQGENRFTIFSWTISGGIYDIVEKRQEALLNHNGLTYRIISPGRLNLNQILSTFKFIDETADWKTYQNNKYHYSIQYPTNWSIDTQNAYDNLGFGGFTYTTEGPLAVSGNFSSGGTLFLRLNDNPDERGRDTLIFDIVKPDPVIRIEDFTPHEASLFDNSDKKETLTISGLPAIRYTDSSYMTGKNINYAFGTTFIKDTKKGVVYLFTYFRPDLAPIISTFKLLGSGDTFMCTQVITKARDPKSGRIIDFPTPCEVPEGLVKI